MSARLDVESIERKRRSTQQMMESAIWDVRFRIARLSAKKKSQTAVDYLQKLRQRTESHKVLLQIDALIKELTAG